MAPLSICVVTATTNPVRSERCVNSWQGVPGVVVLNGCPGQVGETGITSVRGYDTFYVLYKPSQYLGTVPAFREGVDFALADSRRFDLIACLHDDLEILDPQWADRVSAYFAANPAMGLAGFGGAIGLGDDDLYKTPYRPEQLARKGFRSNLVDAEAHGIRSLLSERVACLDGFSQIGRREFWEGSTARTIELKRRLRTYKDMDSIPIEITSAVGRRPWTILERLGMVHHFYDGALGAIAARYGWETWYLPIACKHYGGQTAVGDSGYQDWAKTQVADGDHGFWEAAHKLGYEAFRDVLPLRV